MRIAILTLALLLFPFAAQGQNSNPDLKTWAPAAKAIVTYKAGGSPPPTLQTPVGWNSQVEWKFRTVAGRDEWLWPATDLAVCNALVSANPEDNVYTRNQKAYDNMLAATSGTSDPNNVYIVACEDGAP